MFVSFVQICSKIQKVIPKNHRILFGLPVCRLCAWRGEEDDVTSLGCEASVCSPHEPRAATRGQPHHPQTERCSSLIFKSSISSSDFTENNFYLGQNFTLNESEAVKLMSQSTLMITSLSFCLTPFMWIEVWQEKWTRHQKEICVSRFTTKRKQHWNV